MTEGGRHELEVALQGNPKQSPAYIRSIGTEWLSNPSDYSVDEYLLVEVKVLNRMRRKERKADVEIT